MRYWFQEHRGDIGGYLAVALLVVVVFLLSWHTLTSIFQDIGRHLTLGEIIWESKAVPRTNLFSYTNPDYPFVNHHWLGEVFLYLAERAVGLTGLIALKAVLMAGAFALAFAAAFRRYVLMPALITGLVSAFILLERTDVRPEVLSFVFLAWYLFVLYRARREDLPPTTYNLLIWSLPFVQLLWVNTHIYFFMGPFVWVAFLVGKLASGDVRLDIGYWRKVGARSAFVALMTNHYVQITLAIALATLMNPWGIRGALQPLTIMSDYGYSIVENKSYFFLRAYGYQAVTTIALYAGFVLTGLSFVLNRKRIRENVSGVLLAVGAATLALIMIRNYPLFGLVMLPVVLRNVEQAGIRWARKGVWMAVALLVLLSASIALGQVFRRVASTMQFGLHVPEGHQRAVDFYRESGIKGPIFNNFDIGSYLIWKLPEEQVFIDGRPEAYPSEFIQETYIRSQERADVWERVLEEYGLNVIFWNTRDITPWSFTFMGRLQQDAQWVRVYRENGIDIYVRRAPQNAEVIERHGAQ